MKPNIRSILDIPYSPEVYRRIDLTGMGPGAYRPYLEEFHRASGARVTYGGYLENRSLYTDYKHFATGGLPARTIHLGLDLWAPECTGVVAPFSGIVHSWGNHRNPGDYGPVIILEHSDGREQFYSLYGHLSPGDLSGLHRGMPVAAGDRLGRLGSEADNGGYAPHLHFQIIRDLQEYIGDYPGVTDALNVPGFRQNCPDPALFLGLP